MRSVDATRLPVDPGPAGWNEILPAPGPARELEGAVTADWLVIGGGFAGLSAARRLKQLRPDDRVAVLEASRVGEGPAGRNSGFMIDLPHDLDSDTYAGAADEDLNHIRLNRSGIEFAQEAAQTYGLTGTAFQARGKHHFAATERGVEHLSAFVNHLNALGEPYEWLDARAMKELTGLDYYRAGLFAPGAAILQPAAYIRGLARGLEAEGVEIYEQSPVTRIDFGPDHVAHTPRGRITAPRIILGVNGHAESFGFYRRRLMHVFTYASMTRELSADEVKRLGGEPEWHSVSAEPMGTSVRRIRENRIVVRTRFTYDPSMEVGTGRIRHVGRQHQQAFAQRFPMLPNVELECCWGGRLCLSRNGVPAFGEVEEGVYSAVCQNGLGTAKGTLAGMAAAELATRTESWRADALLAHDQPSKLPPEPFMYVGANAYLRWHEYRARGE
ncbi:NAD(P)/FAD-dependent oxidoreductase [Halofilum ochraceum]|uniref:NAD(P)/FAD-dependent oxidoreductase n=1 Tax=Halofilum ochraceum TaxID=1611323 RepID=UPI00082D347B|nr:FAD-binding oxidoreductase [Halofilum ochraceum]